MTNALKLTRPLVRYHGGKWRLADWIISHFPQHRTYVEPYGGGASVLLKKPRSYSEVYNDLDAEIVNLFYVVREHGEALQEKIEKTPFARDEFMLAWLESEDPLERARRTLIRAYMGFGSAAVSKRSAVEGKAATGFRANSNRSGTTPAADWRNYPKSLPAIIERLRGVVIENRDAMEVMRQHDAPGVLHYVDPPYVAATRDAGGDYRHEMNDEQHMELAKFLNNLEGMVVVSGYESEIYAEAFEGWDIVKKNALADGAQKRVEVLWIKGRPPQMTIQY